MKHQHIDSFLISGDVPSSRSFDSDGARTVPSMTFFISKRLFDIVLSLLLLPVLVMATLVLFVVNPICNPGPVFYVQTRMGRGTKPFRAIKFRSMRVVSAVARGANDPLEMDRITKFGRFLRKSRIDELPQIINVLKSEMSLIGPRPDFYAHAREYVKTVPGYRARHAVKPGISGYAQTEVGYVESLDAVATKVAADLYYIRNRHYMLELWIVWRTLVTVFGHKGV